MRNLLFNSATFLTCVTSDPRVCVWLDGVAVVTCVGVVDTEALVPESGDEEEAIIG